jgi:hypothetical protein
MNIGIIIQELGNAISSKLNLKVGDENGCEVMITEGATTIGVHSDGTYFESIKALLEKNHQLENICVVDSFLEKNWIEAVYRINNKVKH